MCRVNPRVAEEIRAFGLTMSEPTEALPFDHIDRVAYRTPVIGKCHACGDVIPDAPGNLYTSYDGQLWCAACDRDSYDVIPVSDLSDAARAEYAAALAIPVDPWLDLD